MAIFSIFQDGSRRHLGFSNFENFNAGKINMAKLRQCAKFCRNRSNRVRYMVIFRFYNTAVAAMLDLQIFVNFNNRVEHSRGPNCFTVPNFVEIVTCKNSQNCIESVIAMATQCSLTIHHNEYSAKNRPNLLHIIILATSVGQTSCTISH